MYSQVLTDLCTEIIENRREAPLLNLLGQVSSAVLGLGSSTSLSFFRSLGGWPVLEGDNWSGENFDWVEVQITNV